MIKIIENALNDSDFYGILEFWEDVRESEKFKKWKKYGKFWWVYPEIRENFFNESLNTPTYLSMHFIYDYPTEVVKSFEFCSRNNQDQYYNWAPFYNNPSMSRGIYGVYKPLVYATSGTPNKKHSYYKNVKDILCTLNIFAETLLECKGNNQPVCFEISLCAQTENINFESYNVDYSDEEAYPWESYSFGWLNTETKPVTIKIEHEEITLQPNTLVVSDKNIELATPSQDLVFSIKFYLTNGTDNLIDHNYEAFTIEEDIM